MAARATAAPMTVPPSTPWSKAGRITSWVTRPSTTVAATAVAP